MLEPEKFVAETVCKVEVGSLSWTRVSVQVKNVPSLCQWGIVEPLWQPSETTPLCVYQTQFGHLEKGKIDIWVVNLTLESISLSAHTSLALFQPLNAEDYQVMPDPATELPPETPAEGVNSSPKFSQPTESYRTETVLEFGANVEGIPARKIYTLL